MYNYMKGVIHLNTVYEELKSRDLIKQIAFEDEFEKLQEAVYGNQ